MDEILFGCHYPNPFPGFRRGYGIIAADKQIPGCRRVLIRDGSKPITENDSWILSTTRFYIKRFTLFPLAEYMF